MPNKSPIIGIDLGTTYCCVGYLNANQIVEIIENREGHRTTPSHVAFADGGEIIGQTAKDRTFRDPENVVYDVKRLIGQKFDNNFLQINEKYHWPFKVASDADDTPVIEITRNEKTEKFKPQEISAILLKYMKTLAEERLDTQIKNAVITVPAHFNYHQRTATKEAGELAGLNVIKIINEPTAAALAYVHKNEISGRAKNILVFDLGGGTFDVSIVTVERKCVTVKATAGNTALGGRDFDHNLIKFIMDKIEKEYKGKIKRTAMRRINSRSEMLKIKLSSETKTVLELDSLVDDEDVDFVITRDDFNEINSELFKICINIVEDCLEDAAMAKTEIDKIVLIGGSTRIPKIQEMLTKFFEGKQLTRAINPDEAVAYGAAVQAAMFSKTNQTQMHYNINDVIPLSLGIRVMGGAMSIIIPRNSKIPISKTKTYMTAGNNQTRVEHAIYEGERSLVQHNTLIGTTLLNLPLKPPGYTFDITFHVNANGILEVSAKTADGDYTSLAIKYEKPKNNTTNHILRDAQVNKTKDDKIYKVTEKWKSLKDYCTKLEALCDFDKKGITHEEKVNITTISKKVKNWLYENQVREGSTQEEVAIADKSKEIEGVCEPIANVYGYYVKDMYLDELYKLLTK